MMMNLFSLLFILIAVSAVLAGIYFILVKLGIIKVGLSPSKKRLYDRWTKQAKENYNKKIKKLRFIKENEPERELKIKGMFEEKYNDTQMKFILCKDGFFVKKFYIVEPSALTRSEDTITMKYKSIKLVDEELDLYSIDVEDTFSLKQLTIDRSIMQESLRSMRKEIVDEARKATKDAYDSFNKEIQLFRRRGKMNEDKE